MLRALGLCRTALPDGMDAPVLGGIRHLRACGRHRAVGLHGGTGGGRRHCRALRQPDHASRSCVWNPGSRRGAVRPGGTAVAGAGEPALRRNSGRAAGACRCQRPWPIHVLPGGGLHRAGDPHRLHGRHAAHADPVRGPFRGSDRAAGGMALCIEHSRCGRRHRHRGIPVAAGPRIVGDRLGGGLHQLPGVPDRSLDRAEPRAVAIRRRRFPVPRRRGGGGIDTNGAVARRHRAGRGNVARSRQAGRGIFALLCRGRGCRHRHRNALPIRHEPLPAPCRIVLDSPAHADLGSQHVYLRGALDPVAGTHSRRQHRGVLHHARRLPERHRYRQRAGRPLRPKCRHGTHGIRRDPVRDRDHVDHYLREPAPADSRGSGTSGQRLDRHDRPVAVDTLHRRHIPLRRANPRNRRGRCRTGVRPGIRVEYLRRHRRRRRRRIRSHPLAEIRGRNPDGGDSQRRPRGCRQPARTPAPLSDRSSRGRGPDRHCTGLPAGASGTSPAHLADDRLRPGGDPLLRSRPLRDGPDARRGRFPESANQRTAGSLHQPSRGAALSAQPAPALHGPGAGTARHPGHAHHRVRRRCGRRGRAAVGGSRGRGGTGAEGHRSEPDSERGARDRSPSGPAGSGVHQRCPERHAADLEALRRHRFAAVSPVDRRRIAPVHARIHAVGKGPPESRRRISPVDEQPVRYRIAAQKPVRHDPGCL